MNTQQTARNGSDTNMENMISDPNNKTERFIHVYHVDLDHMISDNESERCRLVSKLQQYNAMVQKPLFASPLKATAVMNMPVLGREQLTPARLLDKDWVYMSQWELDKIENRNIRL